jgi:hypothetical protein
MGFEPAEALGELWTNGWLRISEKITAGSGMTYQYRQSRAAHRSAGRAGSRRRAKPARLHPGDHQQRHHLARNPRLAGGG